MSDNVMCLYSCNIRLNVILQSPRSCRWPLFQGYVDKLQWL